MFRIAVCGCDKDVCKGLEQFIIGYAKKNHVLYEVDLYRTGESLCQKLGAGERYDILFLETDLRTMPGVEIGHIVRDINEDHDTQIIYLSGKTDCVLELLKTRPLDFLEKPLVVSQVEKTLSTALKILNLKTRYLAFTENRQKIRVPLSLIVYFESEGKKISVFTTDTHYKYYGAIGKLKEQLPSRDFCEIHKSFIVNYSYIIEYSADHVIMISGISLPISRSQKKEVHQWLLHRKNEDIVVG